MSAANADKDCLLINYSSSDKNEYDFKEEILCGYLNKLSNKSLIKNWKKRWVVYHDDTCELKYFSTPDDNEPIDVIRVSGAVFSFDPSKERQHVFKIKTVYHEYFFEAPSKETCYKWLRHLQNSRRKFSMKRTNNLRHNVVRYDASPPESGLLGPGTQNQSDVNDKPVFKANEIVAEPLLLRNKNSYSNVKKQVMNVLKPKSNSSISENMSPNQSINESIGDSENSVQHSTDSPFPKKSPRMQSFRRKFRFSRENANSEGSFSEEQLKQRPNCSRCHSLLEELEKIKSDKSDVEAEVLAGQEVIQVLQQHVSAAALEQDTANQLLDVRYGKDTKDLLRKKNDKIVDLEYKVLNQESLLQALQQERSGLKTNLENYEEQCEMLKDLLKAKDEAVMSLTNKIFDLETELKMKTTSSSSSNATLYENSSCSECSQLQDSIDAYQFQNQFLNSEVVELNQLIEDANNREEKLLSLSSHWEAKFCQVQSKYLLLLKELHSPQSDTEESTNLVSQLVQDALEEDSKNNVCNSSDSFVSSETSRYDELGFNKTWGLEEDVLGQKVQNLKQRSKVLGDSLQTSDYDQWFSKWNNFMLNFGNKDIHKNLELKLMIRSGIPIKYRGSVWKRCIDMKVKNIRARSKPNYYHTLLASHTKITNFDPSVKQIELDLLRTLPNNKHYETMHSDGIPRLRRVLLAYSWHNPTVGYCQGINRLAGIALLFLDEEDAFWCLVAIIEKIMPVDYYSKTLVMSQVDQRVLKDLMQEKLPRLNAHLEAHNVDLSLVTFTWLLTIYVDNIPVKTYLNIWDSFLYEGSKVLFRYALAIFKYTEKELLKLNDYMAINMFLRSIAETLDDVKALSHIAFNGLQSFSMRSIASKRTHHMQIVRRELEELEAIRASEMVDSKEDSCSDDD